MCYLSAVTTKSCVKTFLHNVQRCQDHAVLKGHNISSTSEMYKMAIYMDFMDVIVCTEIKFTL